MSFIFKSYCCRVLYSYLSKLSSRSNHFFSGWHILVSFAAENLLGHVPHEDSSFSSDWDDGLLIWRDLDLCNVTRVTNTLEVADTFIIIPDLDSLVLTSGNEVLTCISDCQSIDLTSLGSIKHSNGLTIKAIPISDLSVTSSGKYLRLIWMVKYLLEHGGLEQAHDSCAVANIPDDGRAIIRRSDCLSIVFVDSNIWNSASVFFERTFHDLGLSSNSPDSHFTFHTTWHNLLAVSGSSNGCNTMVMSIIDSIQELSRLWKECSDFTIIPSWQDAFAISREEHTEAFEAWYFNSKKFLSGLWVPDSDIVQTASSEELRVAAWEANVVDSFIVASVSQFRSNIIGVAPVDSSLWSSTEEMGWVSSERNGCNCSHDLSLLLDVHLLRSNLGKSTITWSEKEISICEEVDAVDSLREESFLWTNSLEKIIFKWNFNNISSFSSQISIGISWINHTACEHSLNLIHENFYVLNFLLNKITCPRSKTIVMDGDALGGGAVVEAYLVGNIHAYWISNQCFAAFNLYSTNKI